MVTDRLGTLGMNVALAVLGLVLAALAWSLVGGWFGTADPSDPMAERHDIVQLDVRNGCGETGLASIMAEWLVDEGFDVLESGDWVRFGESRTFAVDRIGDPVPARAVLARLGLPEDRVREDVVVDYYLDATLVVGCDYADLPPFRE